MSINLLTSRLDANPPRSSHQAHYLILAALILVILIPLVIFTLNSLNQPTGSYLNPLPRGSQASLQTPSPSPQQSLAFYLGQSQAAFQKAIRLSRTNPAQTQQDKQQIIKLLNQALSLANQAVKLYPQSPQSYQQRAQVLFSVAHLDPSVKPAAEADLKTAQNLAGGKTPDLPQINPIQTLPIEQASLAQNVIIAAPESVKSENQSLESAVTSNTSKGTTLLPSGQTQLTITHPAVQANSTIYLIPQTSTQNQPVYLKSKTTGQFTLTIDQPINTDVTIDYWIVN